MTIRPSNNDITQAAKPVIWANSVEDVNMTQDSAIRVVKADFNTVGLQRADDLGDDDSRFNERPELSDIKSITQVIYYDTKQKKKFVKVTVKIRNSSGKKILGIDARRTKPIASGGTNA